jgi:riboflavin biosynthesis pyrimidine reductase
MTEGDGLPFDAGGRLVQLGLVDEFRLFLHPVVLGEENRCSQESGND